MAMWSKAEFKSTKENVCHEDDDDSSVGMQAWIIVFILGQDCSQIKCSLTFTNCHQFVTNVLFTLNW